MAFFNEFPNTRTYDSDLQWLIDTVDDVNKNMEGLETDIEDKTAAAAKSAEEAVQSAEDARNSYILAERQANKANEYAQDALNSADLASTYSDIIFPRFHIDYDTMELIADPAGKNIHFYLTTNKVLMYEIV